jgi:tetratricopeptide (TPR) repeat protein
VNRYRNFPKVSPIVLFALMLAVLQVRLEAQTTSGSIIGHVRVSPGNEIRSPVLVTLQSRGATVNSVYTDDEGQFGFSGLLPNLYYVVIDEKEYQPVQEQVAIDPITATLRIVNINLTPRKLRNDDSREVKGGTNPHLTDLAEYTKHFSHATTKEYEAGLKCDQERKLDDAIKHYEKAIQSSPDFYPARNNLGSNYLAKADYKAAAEQFQQVIKINPSDATAYFNLANNYLLTKRYDDAYNWVNQGLSKEPDSAFGNFLRGSLYLRSGHQPEAETALRRSLELDPHLSKAHLALVNLYIQQQKTDDAIAELKSFLKTSPHDPFAAQAGQVLKRLESGTPARTQ